MAQSPFPTPTRNVRPRPYVGPVMLILVGVVWGVLLYVFFLAPDWRLHHDYVEGRCVVLEKRLGVNDDDDSTFYRPEIHVRYAVDGRPHEAWTYDADGVYSPDHDAQQHILDGFAVGPEYPVWYDPADPDKAVLVKKDHSQYYWIALLPLAFIVGGLALVLAVTFRPPVARVYSPQDLARSLSKIPGFADVAARLERTGALATPGASASAGQGPPGLGAGTPLPTVPDLMFPELPGAVLPVGLRPGTPPPVAWLMAVATLALGAAAALAALFTLKSPGCATAFLVATAGMLLYFGGRNWLIQTRVGPTAVELSSHPLRPGEPFELHLSQAGPLRLRRLCVLLICEEEVTYRQGTNTRTEKKCVWRQAAFDAADLEVGPDAPLAWRGQTALPDGAMHSFRAPHNEVRWRVVVRGEPAGLPKFERDFPVVVAPAEIKP